MQNAINIISCPEDSGFSVSDVISIASLIISIGTIFFTYFSIFLSKKVDVKVSKFDKMCLENVEKIFSPLDNIFTNSPNVHIGYFLSNITDTGTELNLFFLGIEDVYKNIDPTAIEAMYETFSDYAYAQNSITPMFALKGLYFSTKTKIYHHLYEYSIRKDLSKA